MRTRNPLRQYENTKEWKDTSDGWVKTMTQSKENKEEYQRYAEKEKVQYLIGNR